MKMTQLLLVAMVFMQSACLQEDRANATDKSTLLEACMRSRVQGLLHCEVKERRSTQYCKEYEGRVYIGKVAWPGIRLLSIEKALLWTHVLTPQGGQEESLLAVDSSCQSRKIQDVSDLDGLLPEQVSTLPAESVIELAKAVIGVSQLGRAIDETLASPGSPDTGGQDMVAFGCEFSEDFAPRQLERTGLDGELRALMANNPSIEASSASTSVSLICRLLDLEGSIQQVTVTFKPIRSVSVVFRKTGLRFIDGRVLEDRKYSPQ